jgi:hypothetical protein
MKPFTVIGLLLAAVLLWAAIYTSRPDPNRTSAQMPRGRDGPRTFHPPPRVGDPGAEGTTATTRPSVRRPPRTTLLRTPKPTTLGSLPQGVPTPIETTPEGPEPVIPIEVARAALTLVGNDPDAEDAWLDAINDPALSPEERSDLIEDLNEQGFPDPKNISMNDLPLIVNRIALIEEVGPDAMDDVNADAFAEAYKDLTNMLDRLQAQAAELEELAENDELEPEQEAMLAQFKQYQELHQQAHEQARP